MKFVAVKSEAQQAVLTPQGRQRGMECIRPSGDRARRQREEWLSKLLARRPLNVALANKMARTIWALLAHDRTCQRGYVALVTWKTNKAKKEMDR